VSSKFSVFVAKPEDPEEDYFLTFASEFYRRYQRDYKLEIDIQTSGQLKKNTWLELLRQIAEVANRNIVLVNHADSEHGLWFELKPSDGGAVIYELGLLLHASRLILAWEDARNSDSPERYFRPYGLATPTDETDILAARGSQQSVLGSLATAPRSRDLMRFRRRLAQVNSGELDQAEKSERVAQLIGQARRQITSRIRSYAQELQLNRRKLREYAFALKRVHDLHLDRVAVRGCELGQNKVAMRILGQFLGAKQVGAMKVYDVFGYGIVRIPRNGKFRKKRREQAMQVRRSAARAYTQANGRPPGSLGNFRSTADFGHWRYRFPALGNSSDELTLYIRDQQVLILAEDIATVRRFAEEKLGMSKGKLRSIKPNGALILHFTNSSPPRFPQEPQFRQHLEIVKIKRPFDFTPNL
jgi:hypothetical protein